MRGLGVIILAAGKGKRMRSSTPKVLHLLGGRPMLSYPLRASAGLGPEKACVVVGHRGNRVRDACTPGTNATRWRKTWMPSGSENWRPGSRACSAPQTLLTDRGSLHRLHDRVWTPMKHNVFPVFATEDEGLADYGNLP